VTTPITPLARQLATRGVRYVLIGVSGANLYAPEGQGAFATRDFDLFLPPDPVNFLQALNACDAAGLELWSGDEPLDHPRDEWLAERIIERRAVTRVTGADDLLVDLTLEMKGFDFETVWGEHREFIIDGVPIPTARLLHIVESKQATARDKDKLFLATHLDALQQLLKKPDSD
jgi:hypothetical protein